MPEGRATTLPGVVDRHVHLGLVDRALLAGGPVTEVHDLGWDPREVTAWAAAPPSGVRVRYAGPFHTAPGGYPTGRSWAPDAAVRHVASRDEAAAAVADVVRAGGFAVKVALHAGLPLLPDDALRALVDAAHTAGLPVLVHAEGTGQAERAVDAGADTLVHVPWTETLPPDLIERAARMTWISTLSIHDGTIHDGTIGEGTIGEGTIGEGTIGEGTIGDGAIGGGAADGGAVHGGAVHGGAVHDRAAHDRAVEDGPGGDLGRALDNARRFVAAGGTLVYGTDMGNGPTPVGVNEREIELLGTVLTGKALRRAVVGPLDAAPALTAPLPVPETASDLIDWLRASTRLSA